MKRFIIGPLALVALLGCMAAGCAAEQSEQQESNESEMMVEDGPLADIDHPRSYEGDLGRSIVKHSADPRTQGGCLGCGPLPDPWQSGPLPDPWSEPSAGSSSGNTGSGNSGNTSTSSSSTSSSGGRK